LQIREMLPVRSIADKTAWRRGTRLFGEVENLLKEDVKAFNIKKNPGTMGTTAMSAGENGKKPKTTGSPASWKPIKVRRNTGRTGRG